MQWMLKDGTVLAQGGCSCNAELQYVGDDHKRLCKVGLAVGKRADTTTVWANVVAWHGLASLLSRARKGDPVFVIGKLKSREYNGKTYTDLVADYIDVISISDYDEERGAYAPAKGGVDVPGYDFADGNADDGELPF